MCMSPNTISVSTTYPERRMKYAFEQLTEPGERPPPFLRTTCLVKQNAKLENESADEPTQVEGRTDAT